MNMLDRDVDQLFNAKLGELEVQPSDELWAGITAKLNKEEKKPVKWTDSFYLRAAAGVIIVLSIALLFVNKEGTKHITKTISLTTPIQSKLKLQQHPVTVNGDVANNTTTIKYASAAAAPLKPKHKLFNTHKAPTPVIANDAVFTPVNMNEAVVVNRPHVDDIQAIGAKPDIYITDALTTTVNPIKQLTSNSSPHKVRENLPKRKIHNLSSLLNVVIAKVDKRDDKIIEFEDAGEDGAINVTGVNLGLIAVKKEK
jgi:hypothetical protein